MLIYAHIFTQVNKLLCDGYTHTHMYTHTHVHTHIHITLSGSPEFLRQEESTVWVKGICSV